MALVGAIGLALTGIGQSIGVLPVAIGLFLFGAGNGTATVEWSNIRFWRK